MDNIPEREQPKPEVVKPGQNFQLFKPENLVLTFYSNMQRRGFASSVNLDLFSGSVPISFDIDLTYGSILPSWITPFNPDTGYQITNEDSDPKSRYAKLSRLSPTPRLKNGFHLSFSSKDKLSKDENALKELQRLRVYLFFPSGSYESQPAGDISEINALEFSHFYPLDTGPLPQLPEEEIIVGRIRPYKGHIIGLLEDLPDDMSKLSQIRARFVMADEQP